jgi:hypothetical protein
MGCCSVLGKQEQVSSLRMGSRAAAPEKGDPGTAAWSRVRSISKPAQRAPRPASSPARSTRQDARAGRRGTSGWDPAWASAGGVRACAGWRGRIPALPFVSDIAATPGPAEDARIDHEGGVLGQPGVQSLPAQNSW